MTLIMDNLVDLEAELRNLALWESEPPSAHALASTQPFCVDTLTFPQWLQFVFIPKMRWMIEQEISLPNKCGVTPMAEEYLRGVPQDGEHLVSILNTIDTLLARNNN